MSRKFKEINEKQWKKDIPNADRSEVKLPRRGTRKSAGYDIFAPYDFTVAPGEDIKIPTGLKAYMNDGEVLVIVPRSSLGFKYYTRLSNTCGIIDSDYADNEENDGHIWVKLRNEGNKTLTISQGNAFCQAIFMPFLLVDGDSFDNGDDRIGGFGSTEK